MFEIEKDVEVPPKRMAPGRPRKYPFPDMAVGTSFFCPDIPQNRLSAAASKYGTQTGKKFVTRIVEGGIRCWRIE